MRDGLRSVPLFAELSEDDLKRLAGRSVKKTLERGDELFTEGDTGDTAYVITDGEIEIVKRTGHRQVLLAVRKAGEVIGEMALLRDSPRSASALARTDVGLICIPKSEIDALMESSAGAVRALFRVLLDRWQATQALLSQSERMAQLGTLTAGLAHELNNPASAVNRAAVQLRASIDELKKAERSLGTTLDDASRPGVEALRARLSERRDGSATLDPLTRADLEAEIEGRLAEAAVGEAWRLAPALVDAGVTEDLDDIVAAAGGHLTALLTAVLAEQTVTALLYEVEEGTRRLSAIVQALKSYSHLDQAPVQDVDVIGGLEDTMLILKQKLDDIEVRREYADDLPRIQAYGSELNQVWTNLIDNAADAIHEAGRTDGILTIRAYPAAEMVVVEIEDNGGGIPTDSIHRVFDSFYTTKPPGSGTGLGLNISYAIVVHKHRGDITVRSEPGQTVFRVELPRRVAE